MSDSYTSEGERGDAVSRREHLGAAEAKKVVAKGFDGSTYPAIKTDSDGTVHVTGTMSGGGGSQFDDGDSIDTDSQGNLLIGTTAVPGTARALRCTAGGTLMVDGSAVTQPVSAASLPLPTGAATEATLAAIDGHVDGLEGSASSIDGKLVTARTADYDTGAGTVTTEFVGIALPASGGPVAGGTSTNPVRTDPTGSTIQPVSGTVAVSSVGGTVTVSGSVTVSDGSGPLTIDGSVTANAGTNLNTSALALESGGNLAAAAASLSVLDDWDETDRCKVNPIVGQAGVQGGSGAVSSTTQRVVLATDVALPTGTNSIGAVTATGNIAHDGTDSGNPLKIGGKAVSTVPTDVSASGDRADAYFDLKGRQVVVTGFHGTLSVKSDNVANGDGTNNAEIVAAPGSNKALVLYRVCVTNDDTVLRKVTLKDGTTALDVVNCAPEGGGAVLSYPDGFQLTANTAFNAAVASTMTSGKVIDVAVAYKTVNV